MEKYVTGDALAELHVRSYSGRAYASDEIVSFSQSPCTHLADVHREMEFHKEVRHVQVSNVTQDEFDLFVREYADRYDSIYFFQNPKVKDLSALVGLKHVSYLLFYNCRGAKALWDMSGNISLRGIQISESKGMVYDLSPIARAPALEELVLLSNLNRKYPVHTLEPVRENKTLKRVMLVCDTETGDFCPETFQGLDVFMYRVDQYKNFAL